MRLREAAISNLERHSQAISGEIKRAEDSSWLGWERV